MIVWVAAGRLPINPLIHRTWQDRQINGFICRLYLTNNIQAANWMSSLIQIQQINWWPIQPHPPAWAKKEEWIAKGNGSRRDLTRPQLPQSTACQSCKMSQVWHKYGTSMSQVWQICLCSNIGTSTINPINWKSRALLCQKRGIILN